MGRENGVIYALGFFDGVHKGHQAILRETRRLAALHGLRAGVFTYENHPQSVVGGGAPPLLTSPAERRQIFACQGMEEIVMIPFDRQFAGQSPEDFVQALADQYQCAGLCCGENFHFGARAAGNSRLLEQICQAKGLVGRTAPPVLRQGRMISSTLIRTLLREGEAAQARDCLGRPFSLAGEVVHGDGRGRTMGLPTVNIRPGEGALLPAVGVYAAFVQLEDGRVLPGVTNIGLRPTFRTGGGATVETNILEFREDLYGKRIRLWLCHYLRGERKFENGAALIQQIAQDTRQAAALLEQDDRGDIHELFRDLAASFQIFASNFTARFGHWVNLLLALLALAGVAFFLLRMAAASLKARRMYARLQMPPRDPERENRMAQLLSQAVQIPTVTGDTRALERFHQWMEREFPRVFTAMEAVYTPGGGLLMRWRGREQQKEGGKNPVLLCAHMDVTPTDGQKWSVEPFGGQIQDGFVYGRGALDCKGTLVGLLCAVEELLDQDFEPDRDIYLAFGSDEETGGKQGAANIAREIQRRGLKFDLILDEGSHIAPAHLGNPRFPAALLGVAEKGQATFKLTAKAKAGHAAMPPAHTAAGYLAEAICRIEAAPMRKRLLPVMRRCLSLSAPAMGFVQRMCAANLPATKRLLFWGARRNLQISALLHTTFAVTKLQGSPADNVLPERASAIVNARLLQGDTGEKALEYLQALTADLPVTATMLSCQQPSGLTAYQGPVYQTVVSAVEETYGPISCIPTIMPAGTDTKHYQQFSENIIRFIPMPVDDQSLAAVHGADERLSCQSLAAGVDFYKGLMRRL